MKKIMALVLALAMIAVAPMALASCSDDGNYTVGIIQLIQHDALDAATKGFKDVLVEEFGDKITFWGGVSTQRTLPYGTPEEVAGETRELTKALSKNGGYIIAPAQEIQTDVPFPNLCALIDTAKEL